MRSFFSVAFLAASASASALEVEQYYGSYNNNQYSAPQQYKHTEPVAAPQQYQRTKPVAAPQQYKYTEPVKQTHHDSVHDHHYHDEDHEHDEHHHHHDNPVVHVDVWATITDNISDLIDGSQQLLTDGITQSTAINTLKGSYFTLMTSILAAQDANNGNAMSLAEEKAMDAAQDAQIQALEHDVQKLENTCRDFFNMVTLFGALIDTLPAYEDLQTRLDAVTDKNLALRGTAEANKVSIDATIADVVSGNTALATINTNVESANTNLMTLNDVDIADNSLAIMNAATDLADLQTDFATQTIVNDYYYVNAGVLTFTGIDPLVAVSVTADPAASTFCVAADETIEFKLAATTSAGDQTEDADILTIGLYQDTILVAQSGHGDTIADGGLSRPHSLFYKATVSAAGGSTFEIKWTGKLEQGAVAATIEPLNLQWGYKTWAATYELLASPNVSC